MASQGQALIDPSLQFLLREGTEAGAATLDLDDGAMTSVYMLYDETAFDPASLASVGAVMTTRANGLASVRVGLGRVADLAQLPGVRYLQGPSEVRLQLDEARREALADQAQQVTVGEAQSTTYRGQGVVIGIVDAGIDYLHNAFRTADGELRISRVWEQGTELEGVASPQPFGYGAEFTTPEAIRAARGDSEDGSHGTHVTGIAAGSDSWLDGRYQGVAPEAELVLVPISDVGTDNLRISDAIRYIFSYADSVGKPCVVNLSLGSHMGPHDGTSPFDQMADQLQGPGRLIVGAAGNYGEDHFHLSTSAHRADDGSAQPVRALFNFKRQLTMANMGGDIDIWADGSKPLTVELFAYSLFNDKESDVFTYTSDQGPMPFQTVLLGRVTGALWFSAEENPINGKHHVRIKSSVLAIRTNYAIGLRVTAEDADIWADDSYIDFNAPAREGFVNPSAESTITEIGGTARRILTVGAYTTRDEYQMEGDDTVYPVTGQTLGHLCSFSSYGPTADGRQKPDVTAPGSYIISALSGNDLTDKLRLSSSYTDADGHRQRYGFMHGTSMSTPFVTGTAALLLQACPTLTPEQLREAMAASARLDDFTEQPRYWGSGKVNVLEALRYCIKLHDDQEGIREVAAPFDGQLSRVGDELRVWSARPVPAGSSLALYDASGRLCRRIVLPAGATEHCVPVGDLPRGVYILRCSNLSLRIAL